MRIMISPVKCHEQIFHLGFDNWVVCWSGKCEKGFGQSNHPTALRSPPHATAFEVLCRRVDGLMDGPMGGSTRNAQFNDTHRFDDKNTNEIASLNCNQT